MLRVLSRGLPLDPLPEPQPLDPSVPHAPARPHKLTVPEKKLAVKNALRYFPRELHRVLAGEFLRELDQDGHIYMRRFRPTEYKMQAYPIQEYPAKCKQAAAIMMMIMNNLDPKVAQFPHELVTYGGNGSVFSNWAQYLLVMKFLSEMTEEQTLVMYSGHPMGLFPSHPNAPRVVITNGMMIPNYSSRDTYNRLFALGVTMYGQMTAGSYCYIGPQGIVHGTTLTILNAARRYLGSADLRGKVYISSGLGGMSGAQAKAGLITGAVTVIAETDRAALEKRHAQGWLQEIVRPLGDVRACVRRIRKARKDAKPISLGFYGNVVSLWEELARVAESGELLVELGSDQTSLHNPYGGGYCPVDAKSAEEAWKIMKTDPSRFQSMVQASLRRQIAAINTLVSKGMRFWDYGNCFLLESLRAGAEVLEKDEKKLKEMGYAAAANGGPVFRYPSYVEHFMGDIFSLGFGPFRWICTSCNPEDLRKTDKIARDVMLKLLDEKPPAAVADQLKDNLLWIEQAEENQLVVGSQARILYADAVGRVTMALEFNKAIADGVISAPIVLSRDHHDVSGTDSPFRETANIYDGSAFCADMAVQNFAGDAFRGATWISLHNGGGVGWGEVTNGGFGLVLDGSKEAAVRAKGMLDWDVNNGVARRAWSGHPKAKLAIDRAMESNKSLKILRGEEADETLLNSIMSKL